jgi:hypothetical protein
VSFSPPVYERDDGGRRPHRSTPHAATRDRPPYNPGAARPLVPLLKFPFHNRIAHIQPRPQTCSCLARVCAPPAHRPAPPRPARRRPAARPTAFPTACPPAFGIAQNAWMLEPNHRTEERQGGGLLHACGYCCALHHTQPPTQRVWRVRCVYAVATHGLTTKLTARWLMVICRIAFLPELGERWR